MLEVVGYDPDANVFYTLEGLRFHWKIVQNDNFLDPVLRKVIHLFIYSFI